MPSKISLVILCNKWPHSPLLTAHYLYRFFFSFNCSVVFVCSKAYTIPRLLGHADGSTKSWIDGLFPSILRGINANRSDSKVKLYWFMCIALVMLGSLLSFDRVPLPHVTAVATHPYRFSHITNYPSSSNNDSSILKTWNKHSKWINYALTACVL